MNREEMLARIAATIDRDASVIQDLAKHVGDQIHELVKRHAMTMPSSGSAMALGIFLSAQILTEAIMFGHRSMDGDVEDETLVREAGFRLFEELIEAAFPGAIAVVDGTAPPA